ncbi:MAG TPA: type II toxin-antitoxin system RelE/ParE family toxin [Acetobacteraceae bacterium]
MSEVEWRKAASDDVQRISRNLAEEHPTAAHRVVRNLLLAGERFAVFPRRGRPGSVAGTRELVAVRTYVIVYRVEDDLVTTVRIWHAAQDRP